MTVCLDKALEETAASMEELTSTVKQNIVALGHIGVKPDAVCHQHGLAPVAY